MTVLDAYCTWKYKVTVLDALLYLEVQGDCIGCCEWTEPVAGSQRVAGQCRFKEMMVKESFRKCSLTELDFRMIDMSIVWKLRTSMFTPQLFRKSMYIRSIF